MSGTSALLAIVVSSSRMDSRFNRKQWHTGLAVLIANIEGPLSRRIRAANAFPVVPAGAG